MHIRHCGVTEGRPIRYGPSGHPVLDFMEFPEDYLGQIPAGDGAVLHRDADLRSGDADGGGRGGAYAGERRAQTLHQEGPEEAGGRCT